MLPASSRISIRTRLPRLRNGVLGAPLRRGSTVVGPERLRHLRLAHQLDVIHVRRAVRPLIGARQRRRAPLGVTAPRGLCQREVFGVVG